MSTLNVRINQKYDSYEAWKVSSLVLGKGEIAVAEISAASTFVEPDGSTRLTPPAIGIKVGDGTKTFAQLPWIQSTAGDVYAWAKADKKPEYKAEEITGLEDFIAGEIQDTDTEYQFAFEGDTLTVKSKQKTDAEFSDYATLTIPLSGKVDKVTGVQGNLVAFGADGAIADSGEKIGDFLKSATAASTYATQTELGTLEGTVNGLGERLGTAEGEIDTLQGEVSDLQEAMEVLNGEATVEGSVKKQVADAIAGVVASAPQDFDTLKEIADWIANDQTGAAALGNRVSANEQAIGALEEDSHVHENADVINGITAEKVAAWDGAQAAAEATASAALALEAKAREDADSAADGRLTALESTVGKTATEGLQKTVADQGTAIAGLEEKAHVHANATVLDGISADKVTAWDEAVQSISGVTATKTGTNVEVTAVPVTLLQNVQGDTLIFECGTSAV